VNSFKYSNKRVGSKKVGNFFTGGGGVKFSRRNLLCGVRSVVILHQQALS
jgi:hypothetical protein